MNKDNAKDYLPLVQALADGKKIQGFMDHSQKWEDMGEEIFFDGSPDGYRIKPEPREIWVNRHHDGGHGSGTYNSREDASRGILEGWTPVLYREVIE